MHKSMRTGDKSQSKSGNDSATIVGDFVPERLWNGATHLVILKAKGGEVWQRAQLWWDSSA